MRKLTRFLIRACVPIAAVACASAPAPGPTPTSDRVIATSDEGVIRDYDQRRRSVVQLDVPPDSVFPVLRAVYSKIGVEVKLDNTQTGEIGNRQFTKYYKFGDVPLHQYVGCGTTITGPGADSYRIQMALVSYVTRRGTGSSVRTQLAARADDPGSSKGWLDCLSTGTLEERVNQMLADRFRRPRY